MNKGPNIGTPGPLVKIQDVYIFGQRGKFKEFGPISGRTLLTLLTIDVYFDPYSYLGRGNFDFSKYKPPAPAPWQG